MSACLHANLYDFVLELLSVHQRSTRSRPSTRHSYALPRQTDCTKSSDVLDQARGLSHVHLVTIDVAVEVFFAWHVLGAAFFGLHLAEPKGQR